MAASTNPKSTSDTSTFTIYEADTPWGSAASLDGLPLSCFRLAASGNSYTVVVSYKRNYASETAETKSIVVAADTQHEFFAPQTGIGNLGYITKVTITASSATAGTATFEAMQVK